MLRDTIDASYAVAEPCICDRRNPCNVRDSGMAVSVRAQPNSNRYGQQIVEATISGNRVREFFANTEEPISAWFEQQAA